MKYIAAVNIDHEDDGYLNEVSLYYVPDDFEFTLDIFKEYLTDKNIKYEDIQYGGIIIENPPSKNKIHLDKHSYLNSSWWENETKDYLNWLQEKYNVTKLKCKAFDLCNY